MLWLVLTLLYVILCKQGSLCKPLEMVFQPTRDIERVHFLQLLPFVSCSGKSLAGVLPWLVILCSQLIILNRKRYSKISIAWAIKTCMKVGNVHLRSTSSTAEARLFPALFSTVHTYTPRSVTFAFVNLSCSRSTAMLRRFKSSPTLDQRIVGFGVPRTEQVNVTSSPCFAVILKWNDNVITNRIRLSY